MSIFELFFFYFEWSIKYLILCILKKQEKNVDTYIVEFNYIFIIQVDSLILGLPISIGLADLK